MKMPHIAAGAPAGPERTDASSPPGPGGRLRLIGGCGGASSNRRSTPVFPYHGVQRSALGCCYEDDPMRRGLRPEVLAPRTC